MVKREAIWSAIAGLALGAFVTPGSAQDVSSSSTKLNQVQLPSAAIVLADLSGTNRAHREGAGPRNWRILGNTVVPDAVLTLSASSPGTIKLHNDELSLTWKGAVNYSLAGPRGTKPLRPSGATLEPVGLVLSTGETYVLAFPAIGRTPNGSSLWYRSGAVQQAPLGSGKTINFYDANTDGVYRIEDDAVAIGPARGSVFAFAPISKHVAVGSEVYEIRSLAEDGSAFDCAKLDTAAQKLSLRFASSGSELHLTLGSNDAGLNCVVSAGATAAGEAAVLPGSYKVMRGLAYSPSLRKPVAMVSGGDEIAVVDGQSAVVQMGAPYKLEFTVRRAGDKFSVNPGSFRLRGKAGEIYTSYHWITNRPPEVAVVDGKTVRRLGRMTFS